MYKGFNKVELRHPQRSTFDLSHDKRLTAQMGYLYPVLVQECVPSDTFNGSSEMLVRLAPLLAPIYEQVQVYIHFFFVPHRLLWDSWEDFITGGRLGPDSIVEPAPVVPQFNIDSVMTEDAAVFTKSHLADYLGVPMLADLPNAPDPVDWSGAWLDCMPFCAYQKIWFDYYRDRNFVSDDVFNIEMPIESGNIGDIPNWVADYMTLRPRAYRHDYFRSALPFAQRGAEVVIPNGLQYLDTSQVLTTGGAQITSAHYLGHSPLNAAGTLSVHSTATVPPGTAGTTARIENIEDLEDSGTLINDFRTAYALQVWLERNALGGSRYTESIQAHFGVRPQDSRLQRAEYIGGGMVPVRISEVVSTAWSNDGTADVPQANMAGHGISFGNTNDFSWFCAEHGFIMGILSIINPPSYHQGLPRYFRRRSFLDYPFPTFAKLGEQEVFDWELYAASVNLNLADDTSTDWPVFGYQSRYAEWKSGRNTNHGDFHDDLLFWTLTSDFGITPILSQSFVEFDPNIEERIFAAPVTDNFWIYLHNRVFVRRPLPYFGTPNTLGFE